MASRKTKGPTVERGAEDSLRLSTMVAASPNKIYAAWMDERRHSAFTGRRATVEQWVGGRVVAADGFIYAQHTYLETGRMIAMRWRTTDYADDVVSSTVILSLEPAAGGTKVIVDIASVPAGLEAALKKLWRSVYLDSMRKFFSSKTAARNAIQEARRKRVLPRPTLQPQRISRPSRQVGPGEQASAPEDGTAELTAKKAPAEKAPAKKAPAKKAPAEKAPAKKAPAKKAPAKKAPAKKAPAKKAPAKKAPAKKAPAKKAPAKKAPAKKAPAKKAPAKKAPAKKAPAKKAPAKKAPAKKAPAKKAPAKKAPAKKAPAKKAKMK